MPPLALLVSAVGIAQLISWGTLFYSIGVLGAPLRAELGVSELFVFGAFTVGLLVSGTVSPFVGRLNDRRGGRFVLSAGSMLGAASMALLATAAHPAQVFLAWAVAGAAMAACLYDPAFVAMSQLLAGTSYRRAVTVLTLFGGFASTVFWPLSQLLADAWGWRAAFAVHAFLHLGVCLPIHALLLPRHLAHVPAHGTEGANIRLAEPHRPGFGWLTCAIGAASFVSTVIAVHVVSLLVASGLTQAQAIAIAMLIGPMQVAGRIAEFGFAGRMSASSLGYLAFALLILAIFALMAVDGSGIAAIVFVTAYGWGNGIFTIIRGTTPAELFGRHGLGGMLGRLSRAGLYSRAVAPASYSGILALGLGRHGALASVAALAVAALASYALAVRAATRSKGDPGER